MSHSHYSRASVEHVTQQTLDAGDDLLHPDVPVFTVVLAGLRHMQRFSRGELTGTQAIQEVLIDGTVRVSLAVAGNYAGVTIGLLVFGPAGALVLGSALPVLSRWQTTSVKRRLDELITSESNRKWNGTCRDAMRALIEVLELKLQDKANRLKKRVPDQAAGVTGSYIRWRIHDELRFLREAWCRLRAIGSSQTSVEEAGPQLLTWLSTSTLHPAVYQPPCAAGLRSCPDGRC
ncbi:MAG TPA: hypothetical protein VFN09_04310 [Rhodanobacteraceae bacterium]|nr:hypothetical protein [Rhodanobacteraceae bacterium]